VAWGVFALTGLCFIKRQSLQPSGKFRQLMKAPPSKRIVLPAVPEGTSVFLSQVLAGSADIPEPLGSRMLEATSAALLSRRLQLS
jgi:hypothetical protein